MTFKKYRFRLKHDEGTIVISTVSHSEQSARNIIMMAEGCPNRAITLLNERKTKS